MPNPYMYAVIALAIVLVAVGAYLGMMVNSEAAKAVTLQGELNILKANYTALRSQYSYLQLQSTTLRINYSQLMVNYTVLKSQYSQLQAQYAQVLQSENALRANYTTLRLQYSHLQNQYATLRSQYSQLKLNYTTLQSQYSQLQSHYATLQLQYNQLRVNYSSLIVNYQALNQTYTGIVGAISFYKSLIHPVAYVALGSSMDGVAIFLNITNPTNEPMNVTIGVYMESPISQELIFFPTVVLIPPGATVPLPTLLTVFNSSNAYYLNYYYWSASSYGKFSLNEFTHANLTIILIAKGLTNLGLSGFIYNSSVTEIQSAYQPMGFATYSSSIWNLFIVNPLASAILIRGYEMYSSNDTLLTMCSFNTPLIINATSATSYGSLISQTSSNYYIWFNANSPLGSKYGIIPLSITCTVNYKFPYAVQLPYGYVILNTNIGNITIPLIPFNGWWQL